MTLADKITLARILIGPLAAAAYLFLPLEWNLCFWVCGLLCAVAETTDYLDGHVARARKEVSDFGKLADPFCDVFYRILLFAILLLPAGGIGYLTTEIPDAWSFLYLPPVFVVGEEIIDGQTQVLYGAGLIPFIPVCLMMLREIVAGALRSMAATKGLVLAARMSGKIKAWVQGTCIITACGLPAFFGGPAEWHVYVNSILVWTATILSVYSIIEYIVINKEVLAQLVQRKEA